MPDGVSADKLKNTYQNCYNKIPEKSCNEITKHAIELTVNAKKNYGVKNAPTSLNAALSGNKEPGKTLLNWLKNVSKCNQFVGDVLYNSGYDMPTYTMSDKSRHYKIAEKLPTESKYFSKVKDLDDVSAGDIFVRDYGSKSGESGGHTEVVLDINTKTNNIKLAGAHRDGASATDFRFDTEKWIYDENERCWKYGKDKIYFLKPIAKQEEIKNNGRN